MLVAVLEREYLQMQKKQLPCILITSLFAMLWFAYVAYNALSPTFMFHFTGIIIVIGISAGIALLWYFFSPKKSLQKKKALQKICFTYIFFIYGLILLNLLFLGFMNLTDRKMNIELDFKTWFESGSSFIPLQTITSWFGAKRWDLIIENLLLFLPLGMWESLVVGDFDTKKYHAPIIPVVVLSIWLARFISYISGINIDQLLLWLIGSSIGYIAGQKIKRKMYPIPIAEKQNIY